MTSTSRWLCSFFHCRKLTFLRSFFSWCLSWRIVQRESPSARSLASEKFGFGFAEPVVESGLAYVSLKDEEIRRVFYCSFTWSAGASYGACASGGGCASSSTWHA